MLSDLSTMDVINAMNNKGGFIFNFFQIQRIHIEIIKCMIYPIVCDAMLLIFLK